MKLLNRLKPRADLHDTSFQISVLFDSQTLIIGFLSAVFYAPIHAPTLFIIIYSISLVCL